MRIWFKFKEKDFNFQSIRAKPNSNNNGKNKQIHLSKLLEDKSNEKNTHNNDIGGGFYLDWNQEEDIIIKIIKISQ